MCIECNKCGCDENQIIAYQYCLDQVDIDTECPECGHKESYRYFKDSNCHIDECPLCESDNLDTEQWGYDKETNDFIIYWHCEDCEEEFEIKYNLVD